MSAYANLLLKFLEDYGELCDAWEKHWSDCIDKNYASKEDERKIHHLIQDTVQRDLILLCEQHGVAFRDLCDIIPRSFKITAAERLAILEDLREYVKVKYGR